ncbi:MAG: DUF1674 domain-containing protein [Steroidobacteraceae bacterium]
MQHSADPRAENPHSAPSTQSTPSVRSDKPASHPLPAAESVQDGRTHRVRAAPLVELQRPREIGGPPGPEPTRFGDWEKNGRCIDF